MTQVARAAGVSRSTLHARFPSREDLLRAVADKALATAEEVASDAVGATDADGGLQALVQRLVTIGPQLSFIWRNPSFDHDVELGERWQVVERNLTSVVSRATDRGALGDGRPAWWNVYVLLALVYVAAESIYLGRLAPLDAPRLVLETITAERGSK